MVIPWKSILATLAGATAISADATHERYDNSYGYSYDRYGNAYTREGYYDRYGRYQQRPGTYDERLGPNPAPLLDPSMNTVPEPQRYLSPAERDLQLRSEYERAQRGDFDTNTAHPNSKSYSPG